MCAWGVACSCVSMCVCLCGFVCVIVGSKGCAVLWGCLCLCVDVLVLGLSVCGLRVAAFGGLGVWVCVCSVYIRVLASCEFVVLWICLCLFVCGFVGLCVLVGFVSQFRINVRTIVFVLYRTHLWTF